MGHTNSTANLSLPQFIGSDKPTWLGDINSAFSDIDAYVGTNDAAVSGAVSDAASAVSQAASAVSTATAANTTAGNASTAATNAVGTANNAMSLVNQTNIKIGTLANLNTTDKTSIVNAINEVNGKAKAFVAWTNSSPSTDFGAQNVDITTDEQIDAFIINLGDTSDTVEQTVMVTVGDSADAIVTTVTGGGTVGQNYRKVTASTITGGYRLTFTDGSNSHIATYGTAPAVITINNHLIPYKVVAIAQ